jgi:drug/metabolite transporter (DMT)-like permease
VNQRARAVGYAMIAIAASGWGTWPLILKRAPMPPTLQSAIVMLVVTLASLPVMLRGDRLRVRATWKQWLAIGWLGVSDAGNIATFFGAYHRTSVAIAVLTHYLTPILVAVAAPLVVRERPNARTFGAVAVSFVGLVLLLEPWRAGLSREDFIGAALGSASAVFYASNVLVNKRLTDTFSGSEVMFFHGLLTVPLLFAFVPAAEYGLVSQKALGVVLIGALGPGALSGLLFVWGLRRVAASHASVLTLLEPFVAVLIAAAVLGEDIGAVPIFGGVLILGGALAVVTYPGYVFHDPFASWIRTLWMTH